MLLLVCPYPHEYDCRDLGEIISAVCITKGGKYHSVEMKDLVILQWTEEEKITFVDVKSEYNLADAMSKPTGRTKFQAFKDVLMGRRCPDYAQGINKTFKIVINKI